MDKLDLIVSKYNLDSIQKKLDNIKTSTNVKIGFLGEFSSGKSSLLNSILKIQILPTADKPTSKVVVEISGHNSEKYEVFDENKKQIPLIEFVSKATTTKENSKIYLKVPYNDFLKDGMHFIDTPGISSLDKTDTDITFGYLPYLDGAVICEIISTGSLSESLKSFLKKPEIKPILKNFIFAITKSDLKINSSKEGIKQSFINELKTIDGIGENLENRVALVSINTPNELQNFEEVLTKNIIDKKHILNKEREEKELQKIKKEVIVLLEEYSSKLLLKDDNSKDELEKLNEELNKLNAKKIEIHNKMNKINSYIETDTKEILISSFALLKETNKENITPIIQDMQSKLEDSINNNLKKFLKQDLSIDLDKGEFLILKKEIEEMFKTIEMGSMVAGKILTLMVKVKTAGLVGDGLTDIVGGELAEMGGHMLGDMVGEFDITPYVANFAKSYLIESKMNNYVNNISSKVSNNVSNLLELKLNNIFNDIDLSIQAKKEMIKDVLERKKQKNARIEKYIAEIKNDIEILKGL